MQKISKQIEIEDLLRVLPSASVYLKEKGIKCLACGEPIWGTLEDAAIEKNFNDNEIAAFVEDLNKMLEK